MAERGAIRATPPPSAAADMGSESWVVITQTDVVIICLICGFFVMGCVIIYFHHCADRLFAGDFGGGRIGRQRWSPSAVARGIDAAVIDGFPRFRYSEVKGRMIGKGALECAVCLNEFDGDEKLLRLLLERCHVFHVDCIDEWLASHVTCPVCRANLLPDSGEFQQDYSVPSHDSVFVTREIIEINGASRESSPRSHSTGHSLIQPDSNYNQFILKLYELVNNEM